MSDRYPYIPIFMKSTKLGFGGLKSLMTVEK